MKKYRILAGLVLAIYWLLLGECLGQPTLSVNRVNGESSISNDASIALTGYSVRSANGFLNPDGWLSLQDQSIEGWSEANPKPTGVGELNLTNQTTLNVDTDLGLGNLFNASAGPRTDEDLVFTLSTIGGDFLEGNVRYIGRNATLSVDRATGNATLTNDFGAISLTGYTISSSNGILNLDGWQSLEDQSVAGWTEANPKPTILGELNLSNQSTLEGNAAGLNLRNLVAVGTHPSQEDLAFQVSTTDGEFLEGIVQYVGPANDVVLRIDPETGNGQFEMLSTVVEFDLTGYSILSPSGALSTDWTSLEDSGTAGWTEANPKDTALGELNLLGSTLFSTGTVKDLGKVWEPNFERDLLFNYTTNDGQFLVGTVEYGVTDTTPSCLDVAASRAIDGDLNGDNTVNFTDFLVLSTNFNTAQSTYEAGDIDCNGTVAFSDFLVLSTNFNKSAGATAASVPEPSGITILGMGGLLLGLVRRKRSAS